MVYLAYEQAALTQKSQWNKHFTPPSPLPRQPISACLLCLYEKCYNFQDCPLQFSTFASHFLSYFSTSPLYLIIPLLASHLPVLLFKQKDFFFFILFGFFYSTLLYLPPLRFHCVGGCWDRTQDYVHIYWFVSILLLYTPHLFSKSYLLTFLISKWSSTQ